MLEYFVLLVLFSILVSILTEQLVIRRLQLEEGVVISKGKCVLKDGYGLLETPSSDQVPDSQTPDSDPHLPASYEYLPEPF